MMWHSTVLRDYSGMSAYLGGRLSRCIRDVLRQIEERNDVSVLGMPQIPVLVSLGVGGPDGKR